MKRICKMMLVGAMILSVAGIQKQGVYSAEAASKYTIKLDIKDKFHITEKIFKGAKKIKVSSSKKKIVSAKVTKTKKYGKCVLLNAKRKGKATITVKVTKTKKKRTFRYKISVSNKVIPSTKLEKEKRTFEIQNKQYRNKVGAASLEWSDVLYGLAKYRLKTSGYDRHQHMIRDYNDYLGGFCSTIDITGDISENLFTGIDVGDACKWWKTSSGHYKNMINTKWKSGAIAYLSGVGTIGIYSKFTVQELRIKVNSFPDTNAKIVVRRQDRATGQYINAYGSTFVIRDLETGEQKAYGFPKNKTEKEIYICLTGRRYRIYETIPPDGYSKAKGQTFTAQAARDGTMYITLTD